MIRKNNVNFVLMSIISLLLLQSCSTFSSGSRDDFAIPGCEDAWVPIGRLKMLKDLKTLVVYNCSEMYEQGWRLKDKRFKREVVNAEQCQQSWHKLEAAKQLSNVKFLVTHNCPVFYRHGWIIPPN